MTLDKDDIETANEMAKTLQQSKNDELIVVGNLLAFLLKEREALAQPEHEPVAWKDLTNAEMMALCRDIESRKHSAYDILWEASTRLKARNTTPPQRKPLNNQNPLLVFAKECVLGVYSETELADAAFRAIQAAHGITSKETDT